MDQLGSMGNEMNSTVLEKLKGNEFSIKVEQMGAAKLDNNPNMNTLKKNWEKEGREGKMITFSFMQKNLAFELVVLPSWNRLRVTFQTALRDALLYCTFVQNGIQWRIIYPQFDHWLFIS